MNEKPITISASALELVKECKASNDDREPSPITKGPHLFRWTQLKRAIIDWFVNQADEDFVIKKVETEQFSMFDELQKRIVSEAFANFRSIYPRSKAEINPEKLDPKYYIDAGRGMGATLNMAASMDAYTITDRGTWLSFNNKQDLDIIFSGVPPLHNQYSIIVINPEKHSHVKFELADHFSKWITSKEGQNNISKYQIMGEQLFFPNAD